MADTERRRGRGSIIGSLAGLLVLAGAGFAVWSIWHQQDASLLAARKALAQEVALGPKVQVATVVQGPHERLIRLLGDTRAYQTATLYAKIGGYVKSIAVDRGDRVSAGQVIAEIASDETDRQFDSALSDMENKRRNLLRAQDLVKHGTLSQQAADQADTDFRMATANVAQLAAMKSYETIRAPFGGIITARFVDVGALVQNSTTNQTSNQPVVALADETRLRVDVHVEQRDVPEIHVGDLADVSDAANATRSVQARIARTSGQLDPRTRTLFVELEVDNGDHFLLPGSFAYVTLHVPLHSQPEIPAAGLVVRGTRTFVAAVGDDGQVHLRPVTVANTDGVMVTLADGASPGQKVALNLPDEVTDGGRIQPVLVNR
jgi:RND family efflux transporter MFP subunit